jgi:predicted amidohydrolase
MLKVAIVQKPCAFLNLELSLTQLKTYVEEAVVQGAQLIVFGETWLCGYPAWLDYFPEVALWNHPPTKKIFRKMLENGVAIPGPATEQIGALAKKHKVYIAIGVNEIVRTGKANGSLFNSFLIFDSTGKLVQHHRKLMPTYTEKLLYTPGDAKGLSAVDTPYGKIGGLICWEHWMPHSRQAMHDSGELLHIALWPTVHEMHQIASRHYAFEGRCFVLAAGQILQTKALEDLLELPDSLNPDQFLLRGGSCIIGPNGQFLQVPVFNKETIVYHEIDLNQTFEEKMTLDVSGHYNRPDIFELNINRKRYY